MNYSLKNNDLFRYNTIIFYINGVVENKYFFSNLTSSIFFLNNDDCCGLVRYGISNRKLEIHYAIFSTLSTCAIIKDNIWNNRKYTNKNRVGLSRNVKRVINNIIKDNEINAIGFFSSLSLDKIRLDGWVFRDVYDNGILNNIFWFAISKLMNYVKNFNPLIYSHSNDKPRRILGIAALNG